VAETLQAEVVYDKQGRMTSSELNRLEDFRSLISDGETVCVAHLDPPGQVGIDRITVDFEVNSDRVLIATVRDLLTNKLLVEQAAIAKLR